MLEPPELVTLLPEEEDEGPSVPEELKLIKKLFFQAAALGVCKITMVILTRRLAKTVREMHKLNFPHPRYSEQETES